jgi:hypothetical protein
MLTAADGRIGGLKPTLHDRVALAENIPGLNRSPLPKAFCFFFSKKKTFRNCPGRTEIPAEAKTSGRKRCFFEKKNQDF